MLQSSCHALVPLCLLAAACGGGLESSDGTSSGAPDAGDSLLAQTSFLLPTDGTPNNDGPVGPFCCTGTTLVVRNRAGQPLGYAYFYTVQGQALQTSSTESIAPDVEIDFTGASNPNDPASAQVTGKLDFPAGEMKPGAASTTTVGGLTFTVTIETVTTTQFSGATYFDMQSLTVRVDVSLG